jgi:hypothetical protein
MFLKPSVASETVVVHRRARKTDEGISRPKKVHWQIEERVLPCV